MAETRIEWADVVWNPVTGCSKVSPGCKNCYAERFARRMAGRFGYPAEEPFRVTLHPERVTEPLRWQKPRRVFVNSMSDLFHETIPDDFIAKTFAAMALARWHTFLVLTKRPELMWEFFERGQGNSHAITSWVWAFDVPERIRDATLDPVTRVVPWPLPNVWLGVSCEKQHYADERIPLLLQTPAAVRFVSCEPLLGPIDLRPWLRHVGWWCAACGCSVPSESVTYEETHDERTGGCGESVEYVTARLDWVIVGGETGPSARPMHPDWAQSIRDQCAGAGVPFFFKQWGEWAPLQDGQGVRPGDMCVSPDGFTDLAGSDYVCFANESVGITMRRVGRERAGRLLDGRSWHEFPREEAVR